MAARMSTRKPEHDRWPRPVLAIPRGPRELAWTFAIIAVPAMCLLTPLGWYTTLAVALLVIIMQPNPRELLRLATAITGLWLATTALAGDIENAPSRILTAIIGHENTATTAYLDSLVIGTILALVGFAVLQAYDTRAVTRGVVDERVWQRQQLRRTQSVRRDALRLPPPLTHP